MADEEGTKIGLTSIWSILRPLKHYLHFSSLWLDNVVFRLHCRVTAFIFFVSSTIVSIGQLFGDPIECLVDTVSISTQCDSDFTIFAMH